MKIVSENPFSGKTYLYTIASSAVTRSKQFESLKAGISRLVGGEPKKQPSLPEEPEDSPKPDTGEGKGSCVCSE